MMSLYLLSYLFSNLFVAGENTLVFGRDFDDPVMTDDPRLLKKLKMDALRQSRANLEALITVALPDGIQESQTPPKSDPPGAPSIVVDPGSVVER
jgi:hypothetical protein